MDGLVEQTVKPKRIARSVLSIAVIVSVAVLLPLLCVVLGLILKITYMFVIAFFVFIFSVYGAWYFISSLKIEYEYSFSFGKFTLAKIIDNRKRKNIITFDVNTISSCTLSSQANDDLNYKIYDASQSADNENNVLITLNNDKHKETVGVIFTPEERLLKAMLPYCKPEIRIAVGEILKKINK